MGLPTDFRELQIPGYVLKTLYVIGFFRDMVDALCPYIGLPQFLDHEIPRPDPLVPIQPHNSRAVSLADEICPVVRFSDIHTDLEDCCTVCLSDFESDDDIRQLPNCRHVFHHRCLDRWIVDCCKVTCPVCRDRFLPSESYPRMGSGLGFVWYNDDSESNIANLSWWALIFQYRQYWSLLYEFHYICSCIWSCVDIYIRYI